MHRRAFLTLLGACAAPRAARAQQPERLYRLGVLAPTIRPAGLEQSPAVTLILKALREMGYVSGHDLAVEVRYADGKLDRLPGLARELVQLGVDVIVVIGAVSARAAKQATTTIPIVLYGNLDPVAAGLVTSLAKPEGNVTGVLIAPAGTLAGKKLELLKEAVPRATRIAFLAPEDPAIGAQVQETRQAASLLGIALPVTVVRGGDSRAGLCLDRRGATGGPLRCRDDVLRPGSEADHRAGGQAPPARDVRVAGAGGGRRPDVLR